MKLLIKSSLPPKFHVDKPQQIDRPSNKNKILKNYDMYFLNLLSINELLEQFNVNYMV